LSLCKPPKLIPQKKNITCGWLLSYVANHAKCNTRLVNRHLQTMNRWIKIFL
jgi:hypothetical protein